MTSRFEPVRRSGILVQLLDRIGNLVCVAWEECTSSSQF